MDKADKQQLIKLASKMLCTSCGKRDHEYTLTNKNEVVSGESIIVPDVPTMRCKACGSLSYPSFAYDYIEKFKGNKEGEGK